MYGSVTILKVCLAILLFSEAKSTDFKINKDSDNYGPYDLELNSYEVCIGPKVTNLTSYSTNLVKDGDNYVSWLNCTVYARTRIDEIKIKVYTAKDNRPRLLWSYKLNNPCRLYANAELIEKYWNAKNCVIKQGNYSSILNFTGMSHLLFGSSFFYGQQKIKVVVLSKKGNIMCFVINSTFTKKKAL